MKKHNFFKTLFILVFLLFLALFIASKTGYYEKSVKDKTYLTNKKLKEFEKDISEGKNVDAKDYFPKEVDYSNVFTKSANNISNKIADLKEQIKTIYFETQELIVTSYFSTMYDSLITTIDLERFRNKLYNFKDFLGSNDNYYFFNNYYIQMMEKLDKKFDVLSDTNTYLIPRKESKFSKIIKYIRRIILKKQFENDEI